jgi:hypothetical protein
VYQQTGSTLDTKYHRSIVIYLSGFSCLISISCHLVMILVATIMVVALLVLILERTDDWN